MEVLTKKKKWTKQKLEGKYFQNDVNLGGDKL